MGGGSISFSSATAVHLLCALGLATSYWVSHAVYNTNLVIDPAKTLRIALAVEGPIVIGLYSFIRDDPQHCSYLKAAGRGILGLPIGALLNAFGAIVLGAPLGLEHLAKTVNWSLVMSLFTFVPACCVFGSSKLGWQRLLVHSKMTEGLDYMISLPAHGAVIGGWIGAWPMPLDWDRPWQEWPICVTYGAVGGYLLGMLASLPFVFGRRTAHAKRD